MSTEMPWKELVEYSETHDLWRGEGTFVPRAGSMEGAGYAESDPMHRSGARTFRIRPWLLNEGTFGLQVFYSGGKPKVL